MPIRPRSSNPTYRIPNGLHLPFARRSLLQGALGVGAVGALAACGDDEASSGGASAGDGSTTTC